MEKKTNPVFSFLITLVMVAGILIPADFTSHAMGSNPDASVSGEDSPKKVSHLKEGISGRVLDAHGNPVAGASVLVESVDQPPVEIPEMLVVTEANGQYVWRLVPGHYRLRIIARGYKPLTLPAQVKPAKVTVLDLVLKQP